MTTDMPDSLSERDRVAVEEAILRYTTPMYCRSRNAALLSEDLRMLLTAARQEERAKPCVFCGKSRESVV